MKLRFALCASAAVSALIASPAFAQDSIEDTAQGEEIIVTAVARGQNRIESSVSVSTIGADTIANLAAPSAADLIRQIPGIRSEASGGEGNANIAVRGIPVSTGGGRYVQLQEDGLPILEFGDIVFGNADNFLRADRSVARVEAVRGGSASTFASNAPGAVINFISKTGKQEGGAIQASVGLDFESYRLDFDYGAALAEDLYFHVGGFYRTGEGPRDIGYNGYDGGQIKANITKEFDGGYIRFSAKYLDDRTPTILPQPVRVTGTNASPDYQAIPGFDPRTDSLYSPFLTPVRTLDGNNNPTSFDFRDGLSVRSLAFGIESEFEVGGGWTVTNRFRFSDNSGGFLSPFPADVGAAQTIANGIGGAGSSILFASGPNAGQVANPATIGGNGLLTNVVVFNTRLNSLDNVTNDFRVNKQFEFGGGATANFTTGFYLSRQTVDTDWLWTSHVQTVQGDGQAVLVDIRNQGGQTVTANGTVAYSANFFGNCCRRSYDVDYSTYAPFASLSVQTGKLTLDASIRYDFGDASGTIAGSDSGFGVGFGSFDFDRNGTINPAEASTAIIPVARPVNYNFDYFSFSLGANYLVTDDLGVFARYSQGGRHTADRSLFSPAVSAQNGGLPLGDAGVVATVDQLEAGLKYQSGGAALYATGFFAKTNETNIELPNRVFNNEYEAFGIELEGSYRTGPFSLSAGVTWTDAEIKDTDPGRTAFIGNTPRRQADFVYQATAQYDADQFTLGANIVGTTDSFTQDNNDLIMPGFAQVNAFLAFRPVDRIELGLNATNLFNATGFTEAEEGSIPANNLVRARSIAGRTVLASVRFDF